MWIYDDFIYRLRSTSPAHTIDLPKDLEWTDEAEWSPIEQSLTYSIEGALLIQEGVKQSGRSITLEGKDDMAWISRGNFDKLITMRNIPGLVMILEFIKKIETPVGSGVWVYSEPRFSYNVRFNHAEGAIKFESIKRWDNFEPDQWFKVRTIKLFESV